MLLMNRQRSYSAPAHIVAAFLAELDSNTIIPLREALQSSSDPRAVQRITQVMDFLRGRAATQLGYSLRSLAASYNTLATERKDALVNLQTQDLQRALKPEKLGFRRFFQREIGPLVNLASTTAQLRLTQAALSRLPGPGKGREQFNNNNKKQNSQGNNQNNQKGSNAYNNDNRGGRGGGRRRNGGRGRGKGRGGFQSAAAKPPQKE